MQRIRLVCKSASVYFFMSFTIFLIYCFATWRLASLFAENDDNGPWDMFAVFRDKIGVKFDDYGKAYGTNMVAKGFMCLWCNSIYIGIAIVIFHVINPQIVFYLTLPLAISTGAIMVERIANG